MPFLIVEKINKSYPGVQAVHDFDLTVERSEIVALLGPSGGGKTTLLRLLAGLEDADGGRIMLEGQDIGGVPPHLRGFGLMFQDYALFPHMNVFANVAFGLQKGHQRADEVRQRVRDVLALVGLAGFEGRDVNELSGGEQQRVALARSLAPNPRLLMLDEPLGSLDRTLRERLMNDLRAILKQVGVTALHVTHDQEEAFAVADRIAIMREGRVVQSGSPEMVYNRPTDEWVARFLGLTNFLAGRVVRQDEGSVWVESEVGLLQAATNAHPPPPDGAQVTLLVHPEGVRLATGAPGDGDNNLSGVIETRSFRGGEYLLHIRHTEGHLLTFRTGTVRGRVPEAGQAVTLELAPQGITLWAKDAN